MEADGKEVELVIVMKVEEEEEVLVPVVGMEAAEEVP